MAQSSSVSTDIARDIGKVSGDAEEMSVSSGQVKANADEFSKLARELNSVVSRYKY